MSGSSSFSDIKSQTLDFWVGSTTEVQRLLILAVGVGPGTTQKGRSESWIERLEYRDELAVHRPPVKDRSWTILYQDYLFFNFGSAEIIASQQPGCQVESLARK